MQVCGCVRKIAPTAEFVTAPNAAFFGGVCYFEIFIEYCPLFI